MGHRITSGIVFLIVSCITLGYASNHNLDHEEQISSHQLIVCKNCHQLNSDTNFRAQDNNLCNSCHQTDLSKPMAWSQIFHQNPTRPCVDCHFFHEPEIIKTQNRNFTVSNDELTAYVCQTCHLDGQSIELVSDGHREAADKYYHTGLWTSFGESPSQTCLKCHSEHGLAVDNQLEAPISINVSASHAFGVNIKSLSSQKRRTQIDSKIRLLDNTIECQSCHTLSSGSKDALVIYDKPYDLCNGCHDTTG